MWNMMCDVMPTISEDSISQRSSQLSGEDANFEQLMVSMLDERDKLVESLRETQERLGDSEQRLKEVEKERDSLHRQIAANLPQEFATLTKELNQAREQLLEREEEISELKAERNNTRLLLEHLECLVSRHERSLRMTVVKRQAAAQSGVSSEVEVLKALKSLFEHHKALDEKVRERLRVALERNTALEEELALTKEELLQYKSSSGQDGDKPKENGTVPTGSPEQNGEQPQPKESSVNGDSETGRKVNELQNTIAKQSAELSSWQRRVAELNNKVSELEERLSKGEKELVKKQDECAKLQRDLRENVAQKEDQEERITTLEKRYLNAQRESTSLHDLNEKLEQELQHKQAQLKLQEEKIAAIEEKLELSTQKLAQMCSLPEMEEQLKARMEALSQAQERHGSAEDRIQRLEASVEEKNAELMRLNQRLRMNEEHNTRLSATVDKLLSESNDRLQVHLKERMHALDEKNALTQELEKTRKYADELLAEKQEILKELAKWRMETEQLKRQMLEQEIAFNIQQTDALTRSLSPAAQPQPPPGLFQPKLDSSWEKLQQAHVMANVQQPFDVSSDAENDESDGGVESGHTDAAALALMLQEQLDAINTEIRLIQEEKQTTEARAEELESRVGSYEHMNVLSRRGDSPPLAASPSRAHLAPHHKYHTAPASMSPAHGHYRAPPASESLPSSQLQLCEEAGGVGVGVGMAGGGGGEGAESPLTARSLRLERAARAIHAERDRLRYCQPPYDSTSIMSGSLARIPMHRSPPLPLPPPPSPKPFLSEVNLATLWCDCPDTLITYVPHRLCLKSSLYRILDNYLFHHPCLRLKLIVGPQQLEPGVAGRRGRGGGRVVGRGGRRGAGRRPARQRRRLRHVHRLHAPAEEAGHQELARQVLQQEGKGWLTVTAGAEPPVAVVGVVAGGRGGRGRVARAAPRAPAAPGLRQDQDQRARLPSRAAGRGDARGHAVRAVERAHGGGVAGAVGGHAGLVRGRVPRQRQVRRHHVRALRPGDTKGDRHQQPAAPAEAAAGHPGDGVADVAVRAARHRLRRARLRRHEPRVDRERVAAIVRSAAIPHHVHGVPGGRAHAGAPHQARPAHAAQDGRQLSQNVAALRRGVPEARGVQRARTRGAAARGRAGVPRRARVDQRAAAALARIHQPQGVREQLVGERRARRAGRARRQLRRQQHGARAADTHAEHTGATNLGDGVQQPAGERHRARGAPAPRPRRLLTPRAQLGATCARAVTRPD